MSSTPPKTFDDVLDDIRRTSKTEKEKGDRFEKLMINFFRDDTWYKGRFTNVQLFTRWLKQQGKSGVEKGVDIIAYEKEDGEPVGIQCKCYDDSNSVPLEGINSLLSECETHNIKRHILVYTSNDLSRHAREKAEEKGIQLINKSSIRNSSIQAWEEKSGKMRPHEPYELRDDQSKVHDDVVDGFSKYRHGDAKDQERAASGLDGSRGKMLMACGTGKTLTSLRITESLKCKTVLYLVPSISLIQQTMREWSDNSRGRYQYIAVCSDSTAGEGEEGRIYELEKPPSTNVKSFVEQLSHRKDYEMTVIFSTYQSVDIVMGGLQDSRAGSGSKYDVDLILCDEAHKTATKPKKNESRKKSEESSMFSKAHYNTNIRSRMRLYMTATPRIYEGGRDDGALSMDNQDIYGPTFSTVSFYDAVHGENPVLSDFKVKIAVLPEDRAGEYMGIIESVVSGSEDEKRKAKLLEHKAKYTAAWHGMLKPDDDMDPKINKPLQKVIVFTNSISDSMVFAGKDEETEHGSFKSIAEEYNGRFGIVQKVETEHIDGGMRSYMRRTHLDWLDASHKNPLETRIVSNARCLSEGVDVPSLDGVAFMAPKRSTVDVVQSVGRVMRKSKDKRYGYIILPVVVPGGDKAEEILDTSRFKHVWDVMNALRSHDPRLIAEMSIAGLTKPNRSVRHLPPRVSVDFLGIDPEKEKELYGDLAALMTSRLIKKVGSVNYVSKYGTKMGAYAREAEKIVAEKYEWPHAKSKIDSFHDSMRNLISDSITLSDVVGMIADHVILKVVFDRLFAEEFVSNNPVSRKLDSILEQLGLGHILAELGDFYEDVRRETDIINSIPDKKRRHETRQNFLKEIYNSYMSAAHKDALDKGIVYTPTELVDFIIHSTQDILKKDMGKTLGDQNVQILEPFAGTGTFLTRLIDSGMIDASLSKKYFDGMFANEIKLLAYYIASVNIETTYKNRMKELGRTYTYEPFPNISYTDTFSQNPYEWDPDNMGLLRTEWGIDDEYVEALKGRISKQNKQCVEVIFSNPPWGVASKLNSQNTTNPSNLKKVKRPEYQISERVDSTYGTKTLVGKKKLHDWYIRALRWTTDRIGKCGVVGFVINGSIMRSPSFAGVRAFLYNEFDKIYCFDLRGDARTSGKQRKLEGAGVFGGGSRTPVVVLLLAKMPATNNKTNSRACIFYKNIGDCLTESQKLATIKSAKSIDGVLNWVPITPNNHHDWLDPPDTSFQLHIPIDSGNDSCGIFDYYCNGVVTARDDWVYNRSHSSLVKNMKTHILYANKHINDPNLKENHDPKKMKWDRDGMARIKKRGDQAFKIEKIRNSLYRPFFTQRLYFDWIFNAVWNVPEIMPNGDSDNLIMLVSFKTDPFSVLVTDLTPDFHALGSNKCFALYRYKIRNMAEFRSDQNAQPKETLKEENISDKILKVYRVHYKNPKLTKSDIFYYVYGILHHPEYKKKYANNLRMSLPRIPLAPRFEAFSKIGKQLVDLHIHFDKKEFRSLKMKDDRDSKARPTNMRFIQEYNGESATHPEAVLEVNGTVLYDDLPQIHYNVNGRTPLGWFVERVEKYKKPHPVSGISNDVFHGIDSIGELHVIIKKLLYIGVESDKLISQLPEEFEYKNPPKYEDLKSANSEFQIIDTTSPKRHKKNRG